MSRNFKRPRPRLDVHEAVRRYDVTRLKNLIDAGAPLLEVDGYHRTPLHLAVVASRPEAPIVHQMVSILLSANDDEVLEAFCRRSDDGHTPLHVVAICGNAKLMETFLSRVDEEILDDVLEMRRCVSGVSTPAAPRSSPRPVCFP